MANSVSNIKTNVTHNVNSNIGPPISAPSDPEDLTGASFALLMNEPSGGRTDAIAAVPLVVYNAASTYGVTGFAGYDPGIQMAAADGGFKRAPAATAGLSFGTGDGNIFLALRVDGVLGAFAEIFITTIREAGDPGFSIRGLTAVDAPNSSMSLQLIATDFTTVTATWDGAEAGDAIFNGGNHTWEFKINRTAATVELFVDAISQGTVSIAALAGKSLNNTASSGIGLGCEWRAGIDRDVPITVYFVKVKQTL